MQEIKRVLIIDEVHPLIREKLTARGFACDFFPDFTYPDFLTIIDQYTGIVLRSKINVDREMLKRATRLQFIGRVGSGLEGIDGAYAAEKGIQCYNSPEGNRDAVGEHATGMLLALMNHIGRADRQIRGGQWLREANRGTEIKGKTIGIIGYGNMGRAFAQRLSGFQATVIAYDKYKTGYSDQFTREVSLDALREQSDILSLHLPLTAETIGMVHAAFISSFRKPFWLVNTSRGRVVPTDALVEALQSGKIRGAALDVLEQEDDSFEQLAISPSSGFRYLLEAENVLLTPHVAGWTLESKEKLAAVLVEKILKNH